jgi:hypothetical protein
MKRGILNFISTKKIEKERNYKDSSISKHSDQNFLLYIITNCQIFSLLKQLIQKFLFLSLTLEEIVGNCIVELPNHMEESPSYKTPEKVGVQ